MPVTNPHLKIILTSLTVLFLSGIILTYVYLILNQPYYLSDFNSYYTSAQILIQEPQNLYHFPTQQLFQHQNAPGSTLPTSDYLIPYANPPFFLLLYLPLTIFPPATAYFINIILNLLLLAIAVIWLFKLFPQIKYKFLLVLFTLSLPQVFSTLLMNQNAFWGLLIFTSVYAGLKNRYWFVTGLSASLLVYKPQLSILLFIYILLKKNFRLTIGLVAGLIALGALSILIDPYFPLDFLKSLKNFSDYTHASPLNRITWWGLFLQLKQIWRSLPVTYLSLTFSILTISIILLKIFRKSRGADSKLPSLRAGSKLHFEPNLSRAGAVFTTCSPMESDTRPQRSHRTETFQQASLPHTFTLLILGTLLSSMHAHGQESILLLIPIYYLFSQTYNQTKNNLTIWQFNSTAVYFTVTLGWLIFFHDTLSRFYAFPPALLPNLYLFGLLILFLLPYKTSPFQVKLNVQT